MSEFVTGEERSLLAAEFVLGTLDAEERTGASALLDADEQFRQLVGTWERRLGDLHLMVEPVEPGPEIWRRVKTRLNGAWPSIAPPEAAEIPPEPVSDNQPALGASEFEKLEQAIEPETLAGLSLPANTPESLQEPEAREAVAPADPEVAEPQSGLARAGAERVDAALAEALVVEAIAPPPLREQPLPEPLVATEAKGPLTPIIPDARSRREAKARKSVRRDRAGPWPAVAVLMTLIAAALAGLIVAWRYAPDRLPPQLRPAVLLNIAQAPPALPTKRPAPPDSLFEE